MHAAELSAQSRVLIDQSRELRRHSALTIEYGTALRSTCDAHSDRLPLPAADEAREPVR